MVEAVPHFGRCGRPWAAAGPTAYIILNRSNVPSRRPLRSRERPMTMYLYPDHAHPIGISGKPWFRVKDDKYFPDIGHPKGVGFKPWFTVKSGGLVHTAAGHPDGVSSRPWFRVEHSKLFPEVSHPEGHGVRAWYQIR